jgi:hypothetical protein
MREQILDKVQKPKKAQHKRILTLGNKSNMRNMTGRNPKSFPKDRIVSRRRAEVKQSF